MEFPKQIKDTVYRLLQEPTLDHFREFLQDQTGEHNAIDFKQEWIEKDKLAKLMLALANYGGGIVVFGVHENDDKTFSCDGLKELQAKEQIGAWIKPYLSSSLKYDVYDFSYQTSEYEALKGKQFQMLFVEDTPQFLPFISRKEGSNIKPATIYIRRGTSDEQVTEEELSYILERRMKHIFPVTGKPLVLEEHLEQLKILYNHIEPTISKIKNPEAIPFAQALKTLAELARGITGGYEYETEKNPLYPEESYEQFIAALIGMPITPELFLAFVDTVQRVPRIIIIDDNSVKRMNSKQINKDLLISNRIDLLSYIDFSIDAEKEDDEQVYQLLHTDKETALKQYEDMMSSKEIKYWG